MATSRTTDVAGALLALALPPLVLVSLALGSAAQASSTGSGCAGRYGWPVAPFAEPHPVRANFGDPRTRFAGPQGEDTLLTGSGTFSFHQGVDISAPDGSPVYAVSSGTVVRARGGRVTVDCGNGRSFQYWHVEPIARVGQQAVAGKTLLGFVQPKREHVHLTELANGRAVNPLAAGHIAPYRDATVPRVLGITVRHAANGHLRFIVDATDTPALAVPGRWHGFPVSPALVTWRIERSGNLVSSGTASDFRRFVPKNDRFWDTFARGTHQNWPIFAGRKLQGTPGVYLYRLTTAALAAGTYSITVTARDTRGNRGVRRLRFGVNGAGLSRP
ncbi:MAG TPA: M23 family metallopeptidase [Gaiellaceae bacterium]|nr:M23 family metallopeptidase [Gaiellaceae bacterium]